jgi:hypothetical protein
MFNVLSFKFMGLIPILSGFLELYHGDYETEQIIKTPKRF